MVTYTKINMGSEKTAVQPQQFFKLSRDLHSAYDLGDSTSCIFVDYKKAFETLSHKILMEKMHAYMDLARKVLDD